MKFQFLNCKSLGFTSPLMFSHKLLPFIARLQFLSSFEQIMVIFTAFRANFSSLLMCFLYPCVSMQSHVIFLSTIAQTKPGKYYHLHYERPRIRVITRQLNKTEEQKSIKMKRINEPDYEQGR